MQQGNQLPACPFPSERALVPLLRTSPTGCFLPKVTSKISSTGEIVTDAVADWCEQPPRSRRVDRIATPSDLILCEAIARDATNVPEDQLLEWRHPHLATNSQKPNAWRQIVPTFGRINLWHRPCCSP